MRLLLGKDATVYIVSIVSKYSHIKTIQQNANLYFGRENQENQLCKLN